MFNSKCSGLFLVPLSSKQFSVTKERSWRCDKQEGWQRSSFDLPMDPLYENIPNSWQSWESKVEPLMEDPIGNPIPFQNPKYFRRKGRLRPGLSDIGYKRVDILHFSSTSVIFQVISSWRRQIPNSLGKSYQQREDIFNQLNLKVVIIWISLMRYP